MSILSRFFRRIKFRRSIKTDQSNNVVDSMVKARALYRELSIKAHPDKNIGNKEIAEDLIKRIVANRFNYAGLVALEKEVDENLK